MAVGSDGSRVEFGQKSCQKLNQIAGHDAAFGACPAICSNGGVRTKERSKLMDKVKSSVVDRGAVRGAAERVRKCVRRNGRVAGEPMRQAVIRQAVDAVTKEIEKNPVGFARYIVSRMLWDVMANRGSVEVYVA